MDTLIHKIYTKEKLDELGLLGELPKHVGLIMDGNGRWGKKRLLTRSLGHRAGIENLRGGAVPVFG